MSRMPLQRQRFTLRPISLAACLLGGAQAALALPQGAMPSFGQTTVNQTAPGQLTIQQGTQRAGIDWTSFSIGANERVVVQQPGSSSVLLNRVLGSDPSQIYGSLQSNGSVWLINPRGIVFGPGSQVDVGGLVASTLSITNQDLASGRLVLGSGAAGAGDIVSAGRISAPGGTVVLAAPQLTQTGSIDARRIGLVAATNVQVDVEGDGLIFFDARNDGSLPARLSLLGSLNADGGSAEVRAAARAGFADTVLNLEGVVQARSIGERNGRIVIDGGSDGTTRVAGTLDASGTKIGEHGGDVAVLGQQVLLDSGASIDASGSAGGGGIRVGGDLQGRNPSLHNADNVSVMAGARLDASAGSEGDGGRVIVWSDGTTQFAGAITARGGSRSGVGGFAEVSGKALLEFTPQQSVDLSAPGGLAGTLLLDPADVNIDNTGTEVLGGSFTGTAPADRVYGSSTKTSNLLWNTIVTQLGVSNVVITTSDAGTSSGAGNITVVHGNTYSSNNQLSLLANGSVTVNAGAAITNSGSGGLALLSGWDGASVSSPTYSASAGAVSIGANISLGGALTIRAGTTSGTTLSANLSSTTLSLTNGLVLSGAPQIAVSGASTIGSVISGSGSLTKAGTGTLTLSGANTYTGKTSIQAGTLSVASINSVSGGAASSNLGAPTTLAAGTIDLGSGTTAGTLLYTGTGETTDRVINLAGTTGGGTIDQSGTGALKFSSALTTTGAGSKTLTLQGSTAGTGELAGAVVDNSATDKTSLAKSGSGGWTLSGANTYSGGTSVGAGTLTLGADGALPGAMVVNGGTLDIGTHSNTVASLSLQGGSITGSTGVLTSQATIDAQSGNVSAILGGAVGLTKSTAGTVTLSGANTYTGTTTVSAGTLALGADNVLPGAVVVSGGTLDIGTHSDTVASLSLQGGSVSGTSGVMTSSADVDARSGSVSAILGGTHGLTKTTAGTVTLSGANTYTGTTTVGAGTLTLGADNTLPGAVVVSGGTLDIGTHSDTVASLSLQGGSVSGTTGVMTSSADVDAQSGSISAILGGTHGLTKSGSGTVTLSGANTYTGATTVGNGTLSVASVFVSGGASNLGNAISAVVLGDGTNQGTLSYTGAADTFVRGLSIGAGGGSLANAGSGTLTLATGGIGGTGNLTLGGSADIAVSSVIANSGSLTKTGADTVTLSGANTYTGATTVGNGTLSVSSVVVSGGTSNLGNATSAVVLGDGTNQGTLSYTGAAATFTRGLSIGAGGGSLANAGSGTLTLATGGIAGTGSLTLGGSADIAVSSVIANSGSLTKTGTDTVTLSGANTYTGTTTVGNGTLTVSNVVVSGGASNLGNAISAVVLGDGTNQGTLSYAGAADTFTRGLSIGAGGGSLGNVGSGTLTLATGGIGGTGNLTLGGSADIAVTSVIANSGSLTKTGADTVILSGANSYGATSITNGVLQVGSGSNSGTLGSGSVAIASPGQLVVNRSGTLTIAGALSGSGALTLSGTGTTSLTGANGSYSGAITVNAGMLQVSGASANAGTGSIALGGNTLDIANGAVLTNNLTFSSGANVTSSTGNGTLGTLGTNTVMPQSGAATLNLSSDKLADTLTVNSLIQDNGANAASIAITGGTVVLNGANTYTGSTKISKGAKLSGNTGSGPLDIGSGTFDIKNGATYSKALLSGGGTITNSNGSGTLSGLLTIYGSSPTTLDSTGSGLTLTGGISESPLNAGVGIVKTGSGTVTLATPGAYTYTGTTTVSAGTLVLGATNIFATGNALVVNGGTLNMGATSQTLGSVSLQSGSITGTGVLTSATDYDLQGGSANVVLAGTVGLTKTGSGSATLGGANTYTGTTTVSAGTLALGASERLADTGALVVSGGTFSLGGFTETVASVQQTGGTIANGTLVSTSAYDLQAGTASAALGGAVGLTKTGAGTATLSGANTYTGATTVNAGTLALGADNVLPGAVIIAAGGTLDIGAHSDSVSSLSLQGGSVTGSTGVLSSSTDFDLQSGSASARLGGAVGVTKSNAGSVTLAGANTYTGTTTVNAGTLALGADNVLPGAVIVAAGGTLDIGAHSDSVSSLSLQGGSITGSTGVLSSAADVDAQSGSVGAILGGSAGLVKTGASTVTLSGANTYTGATTVNAGTLALNGANRLANATAVSVTTGATLTLNGDDAVGSLSLAGALGGSGTLSAASYTLNGGSTAAGANLGTGSLTSTGASTLGGTAGADIGVTGGTLTLGAANRIADTAAVSVASGATLVLGGDDTVSSLALSGALAGSGTLTAGSYTLNGGSTAIGANLGAGTLTNAGGTSTLGGTSAATAVDVNAGTLALGAANRLADTAAVGVATGATLILNGDDTVGSLALSGTLGGSGTLSAATYALAGGSANANLGAGTLTSTGNSTLAGGSMASSVGVNGGVLTLAGPNLLADTAAVSVASGATLALGGDDTVGSLALSGTLGGSGTLSAATYALAGGTTLAGAGLGAGALTSTGSSTLGGTAAAATVDVNTGTLTLGGADRLSTSAAVTVASGAALTLLGDNSVASLSLSGSLNGPGALSASSYLLNGGTYNGNLGTGSLTTTGSSTLNGTSAATSVLVESGSLTLGSAGRLVGVAPAVSVNSGATLNLGGDENIGSLTLAGTLGGSGTLTAPGYTLAGGTANAGLGTGALSGFGTLNGPAAVGSVSVTGGALTLGPSSVLSGTPAVSIASGSTLALVADTVFGSLSGSGSLDLGSYTLRTGSAGASTFDGVIAGAGALVKQGSTTFTLAGANTYGGATQVEAGTLALASSNRLADGSAVTVAPGATLQLGGDDTVASLTLQGTLAGNGTLTAASYTLNGGSANANLGAGALHSQGSSSLAGTSAADTLAVDSGTLTLAAANRLADTTAVTVAPGATLALGGDDTVASLVLRGTLAGSGTLGAATYALDGGQASAGLGAGALTSTGASRLDGSAAVTSVNVDSGTLTLGSAGRFGAAPAVALAAGAGIALGGDEVFGSLAGSGAVGLGAATLSVGDAGNGTFAGVIGGSGGLVKQGGGDLALTGANVYTGPTRVAAGSLTLGDGGSSGSLASGAIVVDGTLRSNRADAVTLAQAVSGSGAVEQIGGGTLTLAGGNKSYTGATHVLAGTLATAGDEQIPDASDVSVAAGARLTLGGAETLKSISADGSVDIASRLTTSGDMALNGAVTAVGGAAVTLVGQQISAANDANQWGSSLSVQAGGLLTLNAGRDGSGTARDLVLGQVSAAAGGEIDAGAITLSDNFSVGGGTLSLVSSAPATITQPDTALLGKLAPGNRQIAFAADVVRQTGGAITVADGAGLDVVAANGGSVQLLADANLFSGNLAVRSGAANSPWAPNPTTASFGGPSFEYSLQSRVRVNGSQVNVGGAGIEADVVAIRADKLTTASGATIAARLPFDNQVGTTTSEPGLTLELAPAAFQTSFPFGKGGGGEIAINVGSQSWGSRTLAINGGYLSVLPKDGAQGATAVILTGPKVVGSYSFFFDGSGDQSAIPVFYNGAYPSTPQVAGSLSAIASVSESARKERFEEAVRTENVSVRLRAGVIAEVGPGRPATVGTEGAREPDSCTPEGATLGCGKGSK